MSKKGSITIIALGLLSSLSFIYFTPLTGARDYLRGQSPEEPYFHPPIVYFGGRRIVPLRNRADAAGYITHELRTAFARDSAAYATIAQLRENILSRLYQNEQLLDITIIEQAVAHEIARVRGEDSATLSPQSSQEDLRPIVADITNRPLTIYPPHLYYNMRIIRGANAPLRSQHIERMRNRTEAAGYITQQLTAAFAPQNEEYLAIDQLRENILSYLYQDEAQLVDTAAIDQAINHEIARVRETITKRIHSSALSTANPITATQLVDATGTGRFYAQSTVQDLQRRGMRDPETREPLAPVAVTDLTSYLKRALWLRRSSSPSRQRNMSEQEQEIAIASQPITIEDIPAIDAVTHEAIILPTDQARTLIIEIVSHDPRLAGFNEQMKTVITDQLLAQSAVGAEHNLHDLEKLQKELYPTMLQSAEELIDTNL